MKQLIIIFIIGILAISIYTIYDYNRYTSEEFLDLPRVIINGTDSSNFLFAKWNGKYYAMIDGETIVYTAAEFNEGWIPQKETNLTRNLK